MTEKDYQEWKERFLSMSEEERMTKMLQISRTFYNSPISYAARGAMESMLYCTQRFLKEEYNVI